MPAHSVLATMTLVVAGVTGLVALAYAWIRPVRRVLRPNRERWTPGMWIGALVITGAAVATLVTGGLVLDAALDAVALGNA